MPQKHTLKIVFWGVLLALILSIFPQFLVHADGEINDPNGCEFQPPAASRAPTMDSIRIDAMILGTGNITKDKSYDGLHRWNTNQWPGVDYLVPTTVAFKDGATIQQAGWDSAGGGYSLFITGEGSCQGWYIFIGHLDYNPSTRYSIGQHIGPDEIVGEPGCSGFASNCVDKGDRIPKHNHYTLGYTSNIFNFTDGTKPAYAGGHYWIHPARVEGVAQSNPQNQDTSQTTTQQTAPDFVDNTSQSSAPDFTDVTNGELESTNLTWVKNVRLPLTIPFWAYISIPVSLLLLMVKKIRPIGLGGALASVILIFGFYYATPVYADEPPQVVFMSPEDMIDIPVREVPTQTPTSNTLVENSELVSSVNPSDYALSSTPCEVSSKFEPNVYRWCGLITYYAKKNGLDPNFVAAVMTQESHGDPHIMSNAGAVGLIQVMPRDGISATFMCDNGPCFAKRPSIAELKDPEFNIAYGTRMLKNMGAATDMRHALVLYGGNYNTAKYNFNKYYYADIVLGIYNRNK